MKAKVALLLPDLAIGGAERVSVNLANALVHRGVKVDLVLMQAKGELLEQLDDHVSVVDLKARRLRHGVAKLGRYFESARPAVVLATMWPLPLIALLARKMAGVPVRVIAAEHTTWSHSIGFRQPVQRNLVQFSMRWLYPALDGIVTVSAGAADDLAAVSGLPRARISVIHNPVVGLPGNSNADIAVEPIAWSRGPHRKVLAVGTLAEVKNYGLLLDAFSRLRTRVDARLVVLGEGTERCALEQRISALGLENDVFLRGYTADTSPYYAAADLMVLTSSAEGLPTVLIEALAHGTPIVSTDCPSGPREILVDGKLGTLVPLGDADAFATAMEESLDASHDRAALKRRAQDFGIDKATDAYLELLFPDLTLVAG